MKKNILFTLIVMLFFVTRLYKIGTIPDSVYWDEASLGYNAYSVLKTGHDEWGEFLPVHFRAFGEFKLPVYIYSLVPFVGVFGLNNISVRLPSLIYSLFSLLLIYLLTKRITKNETQSLFAMFLFVVLPWDFIFSRAGYEASSGLTFFLLGIYLFFDQNFKTKFLSVFSFIISIYSYNAFRIVSPLMLGYLIFNDNIGTNFNFKKLSYYFGLIFTFGISTIPIVRLYLLDYGGNRLTSVGLTGGLFDKTTQFLNNFATHFSLEFLFFTGDANVRSQMPGFGQIYLISLPFLLLGMFYLLRTFDKKTRLLLSGLFFGIIPAALTRETPHSLRAIAAFPFFVIAISYGIRSVLDFFKKYKLAKYIIFSVYLIYFLSYFSHFINDYNKISSADWQYGYKQIFTKYNNKFDKSGVYISDKYAQPYIFAAYYLVLDPKFVQDTSVRSSVDKQSMSSVLRISREFEFDLNSIEPDFHNLIIFSTPDDNFDRGILIDEIKFMNGETAFNVWEI